MSFFLSEFYSNKKFGRAETSGRRKFGASHNFEECKDRLRSKGPKIIEKCLKILLDPRRHHFSESVNNLEIIDRSRTWTLSIGCMNEISNRFKKLQILEISGDGMIPTHKISRFLDKLNVSNLRKLNLTGLNHERPMCWQNFGGSSGVVFNSLIDFLLRCPDLESLTLNLGQFPMEWRMKNGRIQFPANFQELCISEDGFPEKFRFSSLDKSREKMTKLCLEISSFQDQDWTDLVNRPFPKLKEFSVISSIPNSGILAKFCSGHPHLKILKIRVKYENLQVEDLVPIRSLEQLTELRLDFTRFQHWGIVLNSDLVLATLNPRLQKLAFEINEAEESVLLNISGMCGQKLEYFSLFVGFHSKFKGKYWGEFLAQCPNLCELRMGQRPKPNIHEMIRNLPNGMKLLLVDLGFKERPVIMKWIRELCEERIKLNQTEKMLTLNTSTNHNADFYEQLRSITEKANVHLVKNWLNFQ